MFDEMINEIKDDTARMMLHCPDHRPGRSPAGTADEAHCHLWRRHSETRQPVHKDKKLGRNDPCPCGSGLKYKKCCGKNE